MPSFGTDSTAVSSSRGLKIQAILIPWNMTLLLAICAEGGAMAADEPSDTDLAEKTQNPVADMISRPVGGSKRRRARIWFQTAG